MRILILLSAIGFLFCSAFQAPEPTSTLAPCGQSNDPNGRPNDDTPEPPRPTPCPENPSNIGLRMFTAKNEYPTWPVWMLAICAGLIAGPSMFSSYKHSHEKM